MSENDFALMEGARIGAWDTYSLARISTFIPKSHEKVFGEGFDRGWKAKSARIAELEAQLEAARKDAERHENALEKLRQWAQAYPLEVFPEPDFKKAHEVLKANGISLSAISAFNMRHVITKVVEIVDAALEATTPEP